jgi:hypothetical protein
MCKYENGKIAGMSVTADVVKTCAAITGWTEQMVYDYCLGGEPEANPTGAELADEIGQYIK